MKILIKRQWPFKQVLFIFYLLLIFGNSLEAYSFFGVPVQWMVNAFVFPLTILLASKYNLVKVPQMNLLITLIFFMIAITSINSLSNDFNIIYPEEATTNYYVFLSLRFMVNS